MEQTLPNQKARLEQSFKEADKAREELTDSISNSVAANCDLLHHGLVSAKGLEVTTEMYRHLLGHLLRHPSGEVRSQVLECFNHSMEKFWPRKSAITGSGTD
ncbi:hypothetical protein HMJ29_17815 [Hymenobacter taeanensis]|uniref:Uncharacterized protein n=1 Tax=Hymenobacter taeanensis TaxID=2735321 RepID=A0A6M6BML2_9BACT|nr:MULTISPECIES: hypothetical protein [Hymenobacter]QJX48673.1 hypothetical protein HMJ29_17815 [Hymenobacter taeanensis]UOQ81827.1 hypothetical protein MUN83_03275 [Hymenobacter sp. 5414T-23]